jgi:hypothetical protein
MDPNQSRFWYDLGTSEEQFLLVVISKVAVTCERYELLGDHLRWSFV